MSCDAKWLICAFSAGAGGATASALPEISAAWPACAVLTAVAGLFALCDMRTLSIATALFFASSCIAMQRMAGATALIDDAAVASPSKPSAFELEIPATVSVKVAGEGVRSVSFRTSEGALRLSVYCIMSEGTADPEPGERWLFRGWLERGGNNPVARRMLWVRGRGVEARRISPAPTPIPGLFAAVRKDLLRRAGLGLEHNPGAAALNRAMLFGERGAMPRDCRDALAAAGTIHVFAISGLHVMALSRILLIVLALTGLPLRAAALAALPLLWCYVAFAGAPPSAVRAAAMAVFHYSAWFFWRRPDGLASWSQTLIFFSLVSPETVSEPGCMLSFVVMFALVLWGRINERTEDGFSLKAGATAIAWLAGAPLVAHAFGRLSPGGLAANFVALPAAAVAFASGIAGIAASFVSDTLAAHLNSFAALALQSTEGLSRIVAAIPGMSFEVGAWSRWVCAAWYAALVTAVCGFVRLRNFSTTPSSALSRFDIMVGNAKTKEDWNGRLR